MCKDCPTTKANLWAYWQGAGTLLNDNHDNTFRAFLDFQLFELCQTSCSALTWSFQPNCSKDASICRPSVGDDRLWDQTHPKWYCNESELRCPFKTKWGKSEFHLETSNNEFRYRIEHELGKALTIVGTSQPGLGEMIKSNLRPSEHFGIIKLSKQKISHAVSCTKDSLHYHNN